MLTRSLGPLAVSFFVVFATIVLGSALPLQLLDPAWQLRITSTLINTALLPLLALALVQIASVLDPKDQQLKQRRRLYSRLAVIAALGFFLLIPLGISAVLRQQSSQLREQTGRIASSEHRLAALRLALKDSRTREELIQRLRLINAPILAPADQSSSLPEIKAKLGPVLDQAQNEITRQRGSLPVMPITALLPDILRNSIASLALAAGFAAFARRHRVDRTLLEEIQQAGLKFLPTPRRTSTSRKPSQS
jgi:hypothetical protein